MIILDKYFHRPIFWDYTVASIIAAIVELLLTVDQIEIPKEESVFSISSDISNISFTSAGFIITLVTVLVTFKSNTNITKKNYSSSNTLFEMFYASDLYFETIRQFIKCIKSLILVSISCYFIKLFVSSNKTEILFLFCSAGIFVVTITLWRCLLILSKILKLQKQE
jgi:hypothetical protein